MKTPNLNNIQSPNLKKKRKKGKNKNKNFTDYGYTAKNPKLNINATFNLILT